jgi:hypothetical protein
MRQRDFIKALGCRLYITKRRSLVRIVEDGEISRCRQTPFAIPPSMRSLAPGVIR